MESIGDKYKLQFKQSVNNFFFLECSLYAFHYIYFSLTEGTQESVDLGVMNTLWGSFFLGDDET